MGTHISDNAAASLPADFHPATRAWFAERFPGGPTPVQLGAWEACSRKEHVLMVAPTGSGKTLAAFLYFLDRFFADSVTGQRADIAPHNQQSAAPVGSFAAGSCRLLYISPLRALNADIKRNLEEPLAGLEAAFIQAGYEVPTIRSLTRSGDTGASERQAMLRHHPEILITTPESLNIMLSSRSGRLLLGTVQAVIVDEIHYILDDKRGTLLATCLERLVDLAGEIQRVGVSATVKPLERAAAFLGGYESGRVDDSRRAQPTPEARGWTVGYGADAVQKLSPKAREVTLVAPPAHKDRSLSFYSILGSDGPDPWRPIARTVLQHVEANRSTLVFANSRRAVERLALLINEEAEERIAWPHHGSLSRELRHGVEARLKAGELRVVVATSSLELGIDIGEVDEVIIVQSPWELSSLAQRLGRAGHGVGQTSRGAFVPLLPQDILHQLVAAQAVLDGILDECRPPEQPLDLIPQYILGECAQGPRQADELYQTLCRAWPYRNLGRHDFDQVLSMLAGDWAASGITELSPRILRETDGAGQNYIQARKGSILELYASGGTIPDTGNYDLRLEGANDLIGTLDEEFVWERRKGERFLLGNQTWEVCSIEDHKVVVRPSNRAPQFTPFWRADASGRDRAFNELVLDLFDRLPQSPKSLDVQKVLEGICPEARPLSNRPGQPSMVGLLSPLVSWLCRQMDSTGLPLPGRQRVIVECTKVDRNNSGLGYWIIHTLAGLACNTALAMALKGMIRRRGKVPNGFLDILPSDNGVLICIPDRDSAEARNFSPVPVLLGLAAEPGQALDLALEELGRSALFGRLFRHGAGRALLISRGGLGKRLPLWLSRRKARRLLTSIEGRQDFPLVKEAWREVLANHGDMVGLETLLTGLATKKIALLSCNTERPSAMAEAALFALGNSVIYEDDTPDENLKQSRPLSLVGEGSGSAGELELPRPEPSSLDLYRKKLYRLTEESCPGDPEALYFHVVENIAVPMARWNAILELCSQTYSEQHWPAPGTANGLPGALERFMAPGAQTELLVSASALPLLGPASIGPWLSLQAGCTVRDLQEFFGDWATDFLSDLPEGFIDLGPELGLFDPERYDEIMAFQRRRSRSRVKSRPLKDLAPIMASHQGIFCAQNAHNPGLGLDTILTKLTGLPMIADMLETVVLPLRVPGIMLPALGQALRNTGLCWTGAGEGKIRLMPIQGLPWPEPGVGKTDNGSPPVIPPGGGAWDFWAIQRQTGIDASRLPQVLWSEVWKGTASNDDVQILRQGITGKFGTQKEKEPGRRSNQAMGSTRGRQPSFRQWQHSKPLNGRWFACPNLALPLDALERHESVENLVGLLFERWPVLARPFVEREFGHGFWREVLPILQRLELAGQIQGGLFFTDLPMPQFMAGELADEQADEIATQAWFIHGADPASLCGLLPELPAKNHQGWVFYWGSELLGTSGKNLKTLETVALLEPRYEALADLVFRCARLILDRDFDAPAGVQIQTIDGLPARNHSLSPALLAKGFRIDGNGLRIWKY